jgi:acetylglutamate synthase
MGVRMKRKSILFMTIVFSLLSIIVPVYADEATTEEPTEQQTQQKNECILLAVSCGNSIISIQDKIQLLKEEIAKGRKVYSPEELNNLRKKLDEVSKTLDFLLNN